MSHEGAFARRRMRGAEKDQEQAPFDRAQGRPDERGEKDQGGRIPLRANARPHSAGAECVVRGMTRRDFLRRAAAGAAGMAAGIGGATLHRAAAAAGSPRPTARQNSVVLPVARAGMKYRTLGRTKLKVSELGMGTIVTQNPDVIHRAMDLGITFFDTAECYQNGNSEVKLGEALKGRRDKVVVATKWHTDGHTPAAELMRSLDLSLQRLKMDHVDLIQIHGADNVAQVSSDELWDAFTQARKDGKVRFNGFSTHGSIATIDAAIKSGRYDAVLTSYSAMTADSLGPVIQRAHQARLGVIAMKVLQPAHEGKDSEVFRPFRGNAYQKAIQWVLKDKNVSTAIVDMPSFEVLEEDFAATQTGMTKAQLGEFEAAVAVVAAGACHLCGACTGQCPAGVKVADIMRYLLYHDGYGHRERAASLYRGLPAGASAAACGDCAGCKAVCPWGVPVRERLERAHAVLA